MGPSGPWRHCHGQRHQVSGVLGFSRTFVRSPVVMKWIEEGYRLVWTIFPPPKRDNDNAPSALEHREFVSGAVAEMLAADAVTALPLGGSCSWSLECLGV